MKILIADDTPSGRLVLSSVLQKEGHSVLMAEDGRQAVDTFEREQPDMVIMDIQMPVMDGYDATRLIKTRSGNRFVPVIFLTSMSEEESLVHCIKLGGDDFLTKPCSAVIVKAKIEALNRIRELHALVNVQNEDLRHYQDRLEQEQELASTILGKILRSSTLNFPYLKYRLSPASIMNGDLLLVSRAPTGSLQLMLGDFTGHGLSAAIGALPAAELFYDMSAAGYSISSIAAAVNRKLRRTLPSHLFCAACLLEVDQISHSVAVWNGGLPDVLVWRPGQGLCRRFESQHPPLGIADGASFSTGLEMEALQPGDRVYLYTDGLIEARNATGTTMFGQERLEACLRECRKPDELFDVIQDARAGFCSGKDQEDDVALVELTLGSMPSIDESSPQDARLNPLAPVSCEIELEFGSDGLRRGDLLPALTPLLNGLHGLPQHKEAVWLILSELLSNALDHGVLGLDSSVKGKPEGFARYYVLKEEALNRLLRGWIKVRLHQRLWEGGGKLVIRVEDSGDGFNHAERVAELGSNSKPSGRGIPLVRSLCQELTYHGTGNIVQAVYVW